MDDSRRKKGRPAHTPGSGADKGHMIEARGTSGASEATDSRDGGEEHESPSFDALLHALASAPSVRPLDLDLAGQVLGRYSVERRIGQGGMGVVYEARDNKLGRKVALKVLRASERGSKATRERLLEEAKRLAQLSHANIATVYDAGERDGIMFLALERVQGRSLRARLGESEPLTLDRTTSILRAIAAALACAHEAGIVHRDLKPENVVVSDGGAAKIIDFGIAALAGSGSAAAGTRSYMAPEQAAGAPASPREDVFAFGVLARELLGATVTAVRERGTRAALKRLAAACCEAAPEARPRDGAALLAQLDSIAAQAPSSSHVKIAVAVAITAVAVAAATRAAPREPAPPDGRAVPGSEATFSGGADRVQRSPQPAATTAPSASPSPVRDQVAPHRVENGTDTQPQTGGGAGQPPPPELAPSVPVPLLVDTGGARNDPAPGLVRWVPLRPGPGTGCQPAPGPSHDLPPPGSGPQRAAPPVGPGRAPSQSPPSVPAPPVKAKPAGNAGTILELAASPEGSEGGSSKKGEGVAPSTGLPKASEPGPADPSAKSGKTGVTKDTGLDKTPQDLDPSSKPLIERPEELDTPFRTFLYAGVPTDTVRLVARDDGTFELVADLGEELELIAIIAADGTLLDVADGVLLWQAAFALER